MKTKIDRRIMRKKRVRAKAFGSAAKPRFSVFRSNKHLYVQLIDDSGGKTVLALSTHTIKKDLKANKGQLKAETLGGELAQKATKLGIKKVVFDRSGYKYHGQVKALAEGARKGGLIF